ncbi:MAG: hypothetical protein ACLR2O_08620 [Coprococcus sp.]
MYRLQENVCRKIRSYRKIVPQVVDPTDAIWVAKTDEQMGIWHRSG